MLLGLVTDPNTGVKQRFSCFGSIGTYAFEKKEVSPKASKCMLSELERDSIPTSQISATSNYKRRGSDDRVRGNVRGPTSTTARDGSQATWEYCVLPRVLLRNDRLVVLRHLSDPPHHRCVFPIDHVRRQQVNGRWRRRWCRRARSTRALVGADDLANSAVTEAVFEKYESEWNSNQM
jgi:hypothetical protein